MLTRRKKYAIIASYFGPYYSNFVASLYAFQDRMQAEGRDVIYLFPTECKTFGWIEELLQKNTTIYFLDYKPYSIDNFQKIRKILRKEEVTLIYSHMCGWDLTAHFACPTLPIVWHMRMGVDRKKWTKRIKNTIKFRLLAFGKTYHAAVSRPVADAINSFHPKNRCVTIYNALDFDRLETGKRQPHSVPTALLFGWAPTVKGLDITLDAFERLNREGESVRLLVSAQEKTYEYIAGRYDTLPPWLELIAPTDDVSSLYARSDLMISASRSEGFSFALAEAIYSGLPVVFSDIPGTSWAREFERAYEFCSENAEELGQAVLTSLREGITKDEVDRNRKKMEKKYSLTAWVETVWNYIEQIEEKEN